MHAPQALPSGHRLFKIKQHLQVCGRKNSSAFLPNFSLLWAAALRGPGCWGPRRDAPSPIPTPTPSRQRRRPRGSSEGGGHTGLSRPAPAPAPRGLPPTPMGARPRRRLPRNGQLRGGDTVARSAGLQPGHPGAASGPPPRASLRSLRATTRGCAPQKPTSQAEQNRGTPATGNGGSSQKTKDHKEHLLCVTGKQLGIIFLQHLLNSMNSHELFGSDRETQFQSAEARGAPVFRTGMW